MAPSKTSLTSPTIKWKRTSPKKTNCEAQIHSIVVDLRTVTDFQNWALCCQNLEHMQWKQTLAYEQRVIKNMLGVLAMWTADKQSCHGTTCPDFLHAKGSNPSMNKQSLIRNCRDMLDSQTKEYLELLKKSQILDIEFLKPIMIKMFDSTTFHLKNK